MTFVSLPALRAREVIAALKKVGFVEDRQKGSHLVMKHPVRKVRTVVPVHPGKTIKKPLLKDVIDDAGLSVEEFLKLL